MRKVLSLFLTFGGIAGAGNIQTFYSLSAYQDALAPGTESITESFAGNRINTPGLSIAACGSAGSEGSRCETPGTDSFVGGDRASFINNQFAGAVGRLDGVDFFQIFTLPNDTTAVGFSINENPAPFGGGDAAFIIGIGNTRLAPFGGFEGPSGQDPGLPNPSFPYNGFVGFISDTPFNTFDFVSSFIEPASYVIDDVTFATPEPRSLGIVGLGLLLGAATLASLRSRNRTARSRA